MIMMRMIGGYLIGENYTKLGFTCIKNHLELPKYDELTFWLPNRDITFDYNEMINFTYDSHWITHLEKMNPGFLEYSRRMSAKIRSLLHEDMERLRKEMRVKIYILPLRV